MAEVDDYFRLKEYDSLCRQEEDLRRQMEEEGARLRRRNEELAGAEERLGQQEKTKRDLNHRLAELDQRLKQHLSPEVLAKLEEEGLAVMENMDHHEGLIAESRTFIQGMRLTVQEIEREVRDREHELKTQQQQLFQRREALKAELPLGWHELYLKLLARKLPHGVFTKLVNLNCQFCRFSVSKILQSEVDTQLMLKSCPGCGRLILPYKVVAG